MRVLLASAYLELPEPVDEPPPEEELPGVVVLLGGELPEGELPAPEELPDVPEELLPLDGDVVEPAPPDGLVAELLPDEDGERGVAGGPLRGGGCEALVFQPAVLAATV